MARRCRSCAGTRDAVTALRFGRVSSDTTRLPRDLTSARHKHLGDALDALQRRGLVLWWSCTLVRDSAKSQSLWRIRRYDRQRATRFTIRNAELLVLEACDNLGLGWRPIPPPGGMDAAIRIWKMLDDRERRGQAMLVPRRHRMADRKR